MEPSIGGQRLGFTAAMVVRARVCPDSGDSGKGGKGAGRGRGGGRGSGAKKASGPSVKHIMK